MIATAMTFRISVSDSYPTDANCVCANEYNCVCHYGYDPDCGFCYGNRERDHKRIRLQNDYNLCRIRRIELQWRTLTITSVHRHDYVYDDSECDELLSGLESGRLDLRLRRLGSRLQGRNVALYKFEVC